ncbi:MAG: VanZ family protein [Bacteroidota bacterium]
MIITSLSLFSFSNMDTGSINIPHADKIIHFAFYFGFVVLGCLSLWEQKGKNTTLKKAIRGMVFGAILFGVAIEGLQYTMTEDRMAELGDVLSNTFGAFVGALAVWWYFTKKEPLKWKF